MHTDCLASLSLVQEPAPETALYRNHELETMWENVQNLFSLVIYSQPHSYSQAYKAKLYMKLIFFPFLL